MPFSLRCVRYNVISADLINGQPCEQRRLLSFILDERCHLKRQNLIDSGTHLKSKSSFKVSFTPKINVAFANFIPEFSKGFFIPGYMKLTFSSHTPQDIITYDVLT